MSSPRPAAVAASASAGAAPAPHCGECARVCLLRDRVVHAVDAHLDHIAKAKALTTAPADAAATEPAAAVAASGDEPVGDSKGDSSESASTDAADGSAESGPADGANQPQASAPALLSLAHLVELMRPLSEIRVLVCPSCPADFVVSVALQLKDSVFAYLLSVRDDEDAMRAWSRRSIARPLIQVEVLLQAARPQVDPADARRHLELFELEWSWAYARCKALPLDRRINAINDIKDVIDCVERKEEWLRKKGAASAGAGVLGYVNAAVASSLSMVEPPPAYTKIWMNSEALCRWLINNRVLEELLDPPTTHVELIRRCLPIMRLLSVQPASPAQSSKQNASGPAPSLLTAQHLDLLWQLSCSGQHESIEHLVYDTVARLSATLSVPLINHAFRRICEKPFADYDVIYLTLIHSFTLNTLRTDSPVAAAAAAAPSAAKGAEQTYGIDLLWTLLQSAHTAAQLPGGGGGGGGGNAASAPSLISPSPPPSAAAPAPEVLVRARTLLLDLLALDVCSGHRGKFMDRCIANVKNDVLVSQSLHILLRLIQMYPLKSAGWFGGGGSSQTQPAVIEALEEKYGLLSLVLQETVQFQLRSNHEQQQQQQSAAQAGNSPAHAATSAAALSKLQLEQLEVREEFLVSILTHSSLTLSRAQVDLVWLHLVVQASQAAARDSVYAWLIDACDSDASIMNEDVKAHLFFTKLLALNPATLTLLGFKLLLRYFLHVHVRNGVLKMDGDGSSSSSSSSSIPSAVVGRALQGEFGRILAKHRGKIDGKTSPKGGAGSGSSSSAASSSALPAAKPFLQSSPSELSAEVLDYTAMSDEEQLAISPSFESTALAATQRICASLSVQQYAELQGIPLLWEIILRNPRARVARQTIVLLNTIHQNLSSKMKVKNVALQVASGGGGGGGGGAGVSGGPVAGNNPSAGAESHSQIRDHHLKVCLGHLSQALQESAVTGGGGGFNGARPASIASAADLTGSSRTASDQQSKKKVSRCILVLKNFLNGFSDKAAAAARSSSSSASEPHSDGTMVLRCVPTREYRLDPFTVTVQSGDSIGDLRAAVFSRLSAADPHASVKTMSLVWDNKKLLTNHLLLGAVGFRDGDEVSVRRNSDLFTAYQPGSVVYSSPSATIFTSMFFDALEEPWVEMQGREKYKLPNLAQRTVANDESARSWARKARATGGGEVDPALASIAGDPASFDRLFSLLSPNSAISESVFDILMLLPTNSGSIRTLLQVQQITPDKWELLLDPKAMYRLLYSLQTIAEILSFRTLSQSARSAPPALPALGAEFKSFDLGYWAATFIRQGGVKYLASIVTNKAWQQLYNGGVGGSSAAPVSRLTARRGSLGLGLVPRAIFHEVLQCIFSLLHSFFSFDPTYPGGAQRANRGAVSLAEGCWTKLPNWETWLRQIVTEAIIPAILNSQRSGAAVASSAASVSAVAGGDAAPSASSPSSSSRDDNSTSMLMSAMRLLLGCVYAVPSLLGPVFLDQEAQTLKLLTVLLLHAHSSAARTQAAQALLSIFKLSFRHATNPDQLTFWLRMLLQLLRSPALLSHGANSQELFLLFSSYLDVLFSTTAQPAHEPLRKALNSMAFVPALWTLLQAHVSTEQYDNYLQVDPCLYGLLQLMRGAVMHGLLAPEQQQGQGDEAAMDDIVLSTSSDQPASAPVTPLSLLSYVHRVCLFNTPADDALQGCKCKTHSTRIQAFALLLELCAADEQCYSTLLRALAEDRMWRVARPDSQWGYDPTHLEKSVARMPVGLKNQSATCYMNAFCQVLFNNTQFRDAIMALRFHEPATSSGVSSASVSSASSAPSPSAASSSSSSGVLSQLQSLFGHLAWSHKSWFDTLDFCSSIRDYSGAALNIAEQKDVNEFASLLFDQIENEITHISKEQAKPEPAAGAGAGAELTQTAQSATAAAEEEEKESKQSDEAVSPTVPSVDQMEDISPTATSDVSIAAPAAGTATGTSTATASSFVTRNQSLQRTIEHTFKGALVHQIISRDASECPHTTAREEAFSMLSLTVVNKTTMEQSLDGFIEGDLLDGENKYMCNQCAKKVAALKRCCLHDTKLPQCLILHLKRFEFDFDSMRKVKVNTLLEFPYRDGDYLNVEKYTQSGLARAEAAAQGKPVPPREERPDGFYEYSLVGVLIHGGSAEGGHYTTLCRSEVPLEPDSDAPGAAAGSASSASDGAATVPTSSAASCFYEFNDQVVRRFNPGDIPSACFGGVELVEHVDRATGRPYTREVSKSSSAYMCIYQRRWAPAEEEREGQQQQGQAPQQQAEADGQQMDETSEQAAPAVLDEEEESKSDQESKSRLVLASSASFSAAPSQPASPSLRASAPASSAARSIWSFDRSRADLAHFPRPVLDKVWQDNLAFLQDKYLFDSNTNWFFWNLLRLHLPGMGSAAGTGAAATAIAPAQKTKPTQAESAQWAAAQAVPLTKLGVYFVLKLLVRNADNASFPQWIDLLYQLLDWSAEARSWFLDWIIDPNDADATEDGADASAGGPNGSSSNGSSSSSSSSNTPHSNSGAALLVHLLFECPIQIVREALVDLVVFVVGATREDKQERKMYFADWQEHVASAPGSAATTPSHAKMASDTNGVATATAAAGAGGDAGGATAAPAEDATVSSSMHLSTGASDSHKTFSLSAPSSRSTSPSPPSKSHRSPSRIARLMSYLLEWVPRVKRHHRSYREFWHLLYHLAKLGRDERRWLVGQGAISLLIKQFYLDEEPLTGFNVAHTYGSEPPRRKHPTSSFWMLQLLSLLVRSCETDVLKSENSSPAPSQSHRKLLPLSDSDRELLLAGWVVHPAETKPPTRHFMPWAVLDRGGHGALLQIAAHWCWEQVAYSQRMCDLLLRLLVSELTTLADLGEYKLLLSVYMGLLCLGDSAASQTARVDYGLAELLAILRKVVVRNRVGDQKLLYHCCQHLLQATFHSKVVAQWMENNQKLHSGWLSDYKRTHIEHIATSGAVKR